MIVRSKQQISGRLHSEYRPKNILLCILVVCRRSIPDTCRLSAILAVCRGSEIPSDFGGAPRRRRIVPFGALRIDFRTFGAGFAVFGVAPLRSASLHSAPLRQTPQNRLQTSSNRSSALPNGTIRRLCSAAAKISGNFSAHAKPQVSAPNGRYQGLRSPNDQYIYIFLH